MPAVTRTTKAAINAAETSDQAPQHIWFMPQEPTFWLAGAGRALTESPVSLAGRR